MSNQVANKSTNMDEMIPPHKGIGYTHKTCSFYKNEGSPITKINTKRPLVNPSPYEGGEELGAEEAAVPELELLLPLPEPPLF
jgi:hypothetical protein